MRRWIIRAIFCWLVFAVMNISDFWIIFKSEVHHEISFLRGIIHLVHAQIFRKADISYPLIRRRTYAYQRARNICFSENFAYVLNTWSLAHSSELRQNWLSINTLLTLQFTALSGLFSRGFYDLIHEKAILYVS